MSVDRGNSVLHQIRLIVSSSDDHDDDSALLERFVRNADELAFATLIRRHESLVWGVCRRMLPEFHDAEDAFQATFSIFVRKAPAIERRDLLANWLHGVAYRVASRVRAQNARRRSQERRIQPLRERGPADMCAAMDLGMVLDEEVERLPPKYRVPFVLCYLQGKTNEQAAIEMGLPKGTILSRLARARQKLRSRLTRRGITLSTSAFAFVLTARSGSAAVPRAIHQATLRAGMQSLLGHAAVANAVSASVASLTHGALKAMFMAKLFTFTWLLLGTGLVGTGAGVVTYEFLVGQDAKPASGRTSAAKPRNLISVASPMEGVLLFLGTEIQPGEKLPADRIVTVKVGSETKQYRRLKVGDKVTENQLIAGFDDRVARDDVAIKKAQADEADADWRASLKIRDEYLSRWHTAMELKKAHPNVGADEDVRLAKVQYDKAYYDAEGKNKRLENTKLQLHRAQTILESYQVRCRVNGVIESFSRFPGEGVRKLDTIMVVRTKEQ